MKVLSLTILALLFSACATPGYVLHSKRPGGLFSSAEESAMIPSADGVALLYDREPLVAFERRLQDGSVWLTYAVVLKNNSRGVVEMDTHKLRLEGGGKAFPGIFSKEDKVSDVEAIDPGTYFRLTVRFKVSRDFIDAMAGESQAALMIVPLKKRGEFKLPLWLWKV